MAKAKDAFRTISEVAELLKVPKHVLRFWENKFPPVKPMKLGGNRRYYRPEDVNLLRGIRELLYSDGYTIKGVQKILREEGADAVKLSATSSASLKDVEGFRITPAPPKSTKPRSKQRNAIGKSVARTKVPVAEATADPRLVSQDARALIAKTIKELEACRALLQSSRAPREVSKSQEPHRVGT